MHQKLTDFTNLDSPKSLSLRERLREVLDASFTNGLSMRDATHVVLEVLVSLLLYQADPEEVAEVFCIFGDELRQHPNEYRSQQRRLGIRA